MIANWATSGELVADQLGAFNTIRASRSHQRPLTGQRQLTAGASAMHQAGMSTNEPPAEDLSHAQQMAALKQVQDAKVKAANIRRGIVVVHTGNGKGKSTAAYGMLLRTIGHG